MRGRFPKGYFLCLQGYAGDCFYILHHGRLEVKLIPNSKQPVTPEEAFAGKTVNIIEKPGQLFGEIYAILDAPRQASILAVEDTQVEIIFIKDSSTLRKAIEMNPRLGINLGVSIASQMKNMMRFLQEMTSIETSIIDEGEFLKEKYHKLLFNIENLAPLCHRKPWYPKILDVARKASILSHQPKPLAIPNPSKPKMILDPDALEACGVPYLTFYPEDVLCKEGEIEDSLYVLIKGSLDVQVNGVVVAQVSGQGTILGENAMFLNIAAGKMSEKRNAELVCTTVVQVLQISLERFKNILLTCPPFTHAILRVMADRLIQNNQIILELEQRIIIAIQERIEGVLKAYSEVFNLAEEASAQGEGSLRSVIFLAGQGIDEAYPRWNNWRALLKERDILWQ